MQLIDASECWSVPDKGLGDKRREMREADRDTVLKTYNEFADSEMSKVLTPDDLGFRDVKVTKQARLGVHVTDDAIAEVLTNKQAVNEHADVMRAVVNASYNDLPDALKAAAKEHGVKMPATLIDAISKAIAVPDPDAEPAVDRKGDPVLDPSFTMTERVPLTEDIDEHMQREVLPFAPDVTWDAAKAITGYEIPFKRVFYTPEPVRPLTEIDADVAEVMGRLMEKFGQVRK